MIENIVWVLPRSRRINKYVGGFPQWFEKKLFELYPSKRILQPFGGMSEHGDLMDINPEVKPLFVGDAHYLPIADNTYDFVLLDPPYSVNLSGKLYNTGALHYYKYTAEAVRVCKPGGFIGTYHWFITARPIGTEYDKRIVILTRIWHHPRICTVFQKI